MVLKFAHLIVEVTFSATTMLVGSCNGAVQQLLELNIPVFVLIPCYADRAAQVFFFIISIVYIVL